MIGALLCTLLTLPLAATRPVAPGRILAVCPPHLQGGLGPWVRHRTAQGWQVELVAPHTEATRLREELRRRASASAVPVRHVVLWGDCNLGTQHGLFQFNGPQVPTFYEPAPVTQLFGSSQQLATDAPYGELEQDGVPDAAVGRVPADNLAELVQFVDRIIAYETSDDFGAWRQRVNLVAGVGGFGLMADTAIEAATRAIIGGHLPESLDVNVCYASPTSPFFPGAAAFHQATLDSFNEGSLAWVYVGHGNITELDRVPGTPDNRPIVSKSEVAKLRRHPTQAPIAVMLACYTGAYDAPDDCLAERMLLTGGGPIAIVAGTRMTLPYGNARLAQLLIDGWFDSQQETIGEALRDARSTMMTEADGDSSSAAVFDLLASVLKPHDLPLAKERQEHSRLLNLLGDPSMRLPHPAALPLDAPRVANANGTIEITGSAEFEGKLEVQLCWPRDRVPGAANRESDPAQRYELANRDVLSKDRLDVPAGEFRLRLPVPAEATGRLIVRGLLAGKEAMALGSTTLMVLPSS